MRFQMRMFVDGNHKFTLSPLIFPFSLSEDEAFELCLGLQTLLELNVRSSFALLIFSLPYHVAFGVFFFFFKEAAGMVTWLLKISKREGEEEIKMLLWLKKYTISGGKR